MRGKIHFPAMPDLVRENSVEELKKIYACDFIISIPSMGLDTPPKGLGAHGETGIIQ